jgi:hypothetical protein
MKGKYILLVMLPTFLVLVILLSNSVSAAVGHWSSVPGGTTRILSGIWGSSHSDIFAVGEAGTILHYDGNTWSPMISGTTEWLFGVWGSSHYDVFAVGDKGIILHYDGSGWSPMGSVTQQLLWGVWGSSPSNVYAVGFQGTILHYDGSNWSSVASGTGASLFGIWGSSPSDIYIAGVAGTILHYNGSTWGPMSSGTTALLYDVWGSSSSDIFVVGEAGTILNYNGSQWSSMASGTTSHLGGVWGSSHTDVYAVGDMGSILHFNGSLWSSMTSGITTALQSIWGSSSANLIAVGDNGNILSLSYMMPIQPPVAADDLYSVNQGQTLNISAPGVLSNDTDINGDPLTAALVNTASNGSLSLNADGSFIYSPYANFSGVDYFTYRANDGALDSNTVTVTINVSTVNSPPLAIDDLYAIYQGDFLELAPPGILSNDSDVDGDPLTVMLVSNVSNGSLTLHPDGFLFYRPHEPFIGADSFVYVVHDGKADSNHATVTIEVFSPPVVEPVWEIINLSITPGIVRVGEPVTISAEVVNTGQVNVVNIITLRLVNGPVLGSQEINIPPGASDTVVFIETFYDPGHHIIAIEELMGEFFVEEAPAAEAQDEGLKIWVIIGPILGVLAFGFIAFYIATRMRRASRET